jgi:hypothetical protein
MKLDIPVRLHNRFDFEVIDARTRKVRQRAYAENIILDSYWARIFTPNYANTHIHVGTGTGTLDAAKTSLFTFLAAKTSTFIDYSGNEAEGWHAMKRRATWQENENQNTAWTEVGVARGTTPTYLTTHALIKDLNGNPVTINKGTTDIINVYSTIYAYYPTGGFYDGNLKIIYPKNYTTQAENDTSTLLAWMMGTRNDFPLAVAYHCKGNIEHRWLENGSSVAVLYESSVNRSGNASTKKLTATMTRLAAANGNGETGIKGIVLGDDGTDPRAEIVIKIPGTYYPYSNIVAESIGTGDGSNLDFATDFPFVKNDSSFKLYKNGTEVDAGDYTVDFAIPNQKYIEHYFNVIEFTNGFAIPPGSGNASSSITDDTAAGYAIVENPFYATYGINKITHSRSKISASDDFENWSVVSDRLSSSSSTITVGAGDINKRYWKIERAETTASYYDWECTALDAKKNIHFGVGKAPALGDTITADYRCEVIAKDANHVFDLTVEITLQEKTS